MKSQVAGTCSLCGGSTVHADTFEGRHRYLGDCMPYIVSRIEKVEAAVNSTVNSESPDGTASGTGSK